MMEVATTLCDTATEYPITMEITLDNWAVKLVDNDYKYTELGNVSVPVGEYDFNDIGQTYTYDFCVSQTQGLNLL